MESCATAPFSVRRRKNVVKNAFVENRERQRRPGQKNVESNRGNIPFCGKLSRVFSKQLRTGSTMPNLGMQFVYAVGHRENKHLG